MNIDATLHHRPVATLGDRVRLLLEQRGLGFNELDRKIGQGSGYTTRLVHGKKKRPDPAILQRIATELGVSLEWLLGGSEEGDGTAPAVTPRAPPSSERGRSRSEDLVMDVRDPPEWSLELMLRAARKHHSREISFKVLKAAAWVLATDLSLRKAPTITDEEAEETLLVTVDLLDQGVDVVADPVEVVREMMRRSRALRLGSRKAVEEPSPGLASGIAAARRQLDDAGWFDDAEVKGPPAKGKGGRRR